jgi:hypothetical protein
MKPFKIASIFSMLLLAVVALATAGGIQAPHDFIATDHSNTANIITASAFAGVIDTDRGRVAYEKARSVIEQLKKFIGAELIVNEDFFRSEVVIGNNTSQYSFQTMQKQMDGMRADFPLQQGVQDKDLFIGIAAGLYIDHRAAEGTNVELQTYPSYEVFNSVTTDINDLYSFYNGMLSLTVDRTVFIPRLSTSEFLKVPQTQQSGANNRSEFALKDSLRVFNPYFLLSGQNTNQLQLSVTPSGTWQPAATSGQNVVTFFSVGLTVQSGADYIGAFTNFDKWAANQPAKRG